MRTFDDCFALFDDATWPGRPARLLREPVRLIEAFDVRGAEIAFAEIEQAAAAGMTAAGYCAYELGYAFEPRLAPLTPRSAQPLLRFFLFAKSDPLQPEAREAFLARAGEASLGTMQPKLDETGYHGRIDRIRQLIADGDVYQVNFAFKLEAALEGDALALYVRLRESARAGAASFLRFPDEDIASLSPERFFVASSGLINARPMKGTCGRAPDWRGDLARKDELRRDPKQRAENLMIVDLLRNDIARVSAIGSVKVDELFTVETYPRFHTMTSSISAQLRPGIRLHDQMRALFPCGSVTGAPKIRAMEIIRELEGEPRGVYCGAVGFVDKERTAFNVAIRTLTVRNGAVQMGVGGGIVWDSEAGAEYAECLLKARFLGETKPDFRLLETMRWSPQEGFFLLRRHLTRLARSARYFGFVYDRNAVWHRLIEAVAGKSSNQRVRLTLGAAGEVEITTADFEPTQPDAVWRFAISERRTNSAEAIYHHKTTSRTLYDGELRGLQSAHAVDEAIFVNERGEVTEGSQDAIFIERDGRWLTPPLGCGVLDGCLRRELIERADPVVEERVLTIDDILSAPVWFGNALRGLIRGTPVVLANVASVGLAVA